MNRDFKGVWIPKEIWLSEELSLVEKCLLVEIESLDQGEAHCYAGNEYFAKFLGCSDDTVSRAIKRLEEMELVVVERKITQHGTERAMRVGRTAKCGSGEPQNAGLLVIQSNINTKDKDIGDPQISSPRQNGSSRIDKAREAWNTCKAGPECRRLAITFTPEDNSTCLATLSVYSDEEVAQAIHNYMVIKSNPAYEVTAPYRSFVGFMRGGVE